MSQQAQAFQGTSPAAGSAPADSLRAEMEARRAAKRRFDVREAIGLVVPLCTHLAEIHATGRQIYVHPSSLRLMQGAILQPVDAWLDQAPTLPRDRACLAPEERKGSPGDARASVFGIGALLYELLTGEVVGPGMRRPAECVPGLPPQLEAVLGKALVADPRHRPADLAALAQALYQTAPGASMAPPPADASHLDQDGDFEVDIRLSMIPPNEGGPEIPRAPGVPRLDGGNAAYGVSVRDEVPASAPDPTRRLADMKARLESDPRPRYVVVKDGMDHGPFSAVELLQQIATGSFAGDHVLRDAISSEERFIKEWDTFAPFAEHAKLNRDIKDEKKAFEATVVKEKQGTQYKALAGAFAIGLVAAVVAALILRERHNREIEREVQANQATAVDVDGGLAGQKNAAAPGAVGGPRPGGGGNYPVLGGGMSCESAQARYVEEYKIGNNGPPDLTAGAYGAVLNRGGYLNGCGVPSNMTVNVCAAVQNGRAVGVTVSTSPSNPGISSCVARAVRGLGFPSHPRLDVARTTFAGN